MIDHSHAFCSPFSYLTGTMSCMKKSSCSCLLVSLKFEQLKLLFSLLSLINVYLVVFQEVCDSRLKIVKLCGYRFIFSGLTQMLWTKQG